MSNVVIVGAGASGLMAGIIAARKNHSVTILEHKDKVGKKILATGNGKCNYTNLEQLPEYYRSNDSAFPGKVLSHFDVNQTLDFFEEIGIFPKEKRGYVYPNSEQASSVVEVLKLELDRLKVKLLCEVHVEQVQKQNNQFVILTNKGKYIADKVILATGGCASPNLGSDGSGYTIAKNFGHKIVKPLPALVQLKSNEKYFKTIAGVRMEAMIKLFIDDKFKTEEFGELLFANYGVSGIPILQLSRFAARALDNKSKVHLIIDFLPSLSWNDVNALLATRIKNNPNKTIEEMLVGLFNNKLAYIMLKEAGISPTVQCGEVNNILNSKTSKNAKKESKEAHLSGLNKKQLSDLTNQIKEWKINIVDTNPFDQAQVSAGGIDTKEVNPDTMESNLVKGLYFTGELLDVDGTCGGYNLQWAWTTGYVAGKNI